MIYVAKGSRDAPGRVLVGDGLFLRDVQAFALAGRRTRAPGLSAAVAGAMREREGGRLLYKLLRVCPLQTG